MHKNGSPYWIVYEYNILGAFFIIEIFSKICRNERNKCGIPTYSGVEIKGKGRRKFIWVMV